MRLFKFTFLLLLLAVPLDAAKKLNPANFPDPANQVCELATYDTTAGVLGFVGAGAAAGSICLDTSGNVELPTAAASLKLPLQDDATTPTFCFGDCDSGIYESADDVLVIGTAGAATAIVSTAALALQDDVLILRDTNAGITASVTQTQGQGPLTAEVNEIATVANNLDTVTLPAAAAGLKIVVLNQAAANSLQIFPASGDDLGSGTNVAAVLEAGQSVTYVGISAAAWVVESTTERLHGTAFDEENTDAFVVSAVDDHVVYHTNGLAGDALVGWTFDAGGNGVSFPIAGVADSAGSPGTQILVTTTGSHLLAVGDLISQTNLTDAAYVGVFAVVATAAATTYEVTAVFTATDTGTMDQAATLTANAGSAGDYLIQWYASAASAASNNVFDFFLHQGESTVTGTMTRRKFATGGDVGSMSGGGLTTVADGDKIALAFANTTSSGNITLRNFIMIVTQL